MTHEIERLAQKTELALLDKVKSFQGNVEYGCYYSARKEATEMAELCEELASYMAVENKLSNLQKQLDMACIELQAIKGSDLDKTA